MYDLPPLSWATVLQSLLYTSALLSHCLYWYHQATANATFRSSSASSAILGRDLLPFSLYTHNTQNLLEQLLPQIIHLPTIAYLYVCNFPRPIIFTHGLKFQFKLNHLYTLLYSTFVVLSFVRTLCVGIGSNAV